MFFDDFMSCRARFPDAEVEIFDGDLEKHVDEFLYRACTPDPAAERQRFVSILHLMMLFIVATFGGLCFS